MSNRFVENDRERGLLINFINEQDLPFTASISTGGKRTARQNRLNRKWMVEIADHMGWTAEYARGYCKLTIGVPILKEDEDFAAKYDRVVRPLAMETKLQLMQEPFDFPVTRLMSTKQQSQYMDEVFRYFSEKGVVLTVPEDMRQNPGASSPSAQPVDGAEAIPSGSAPSSITSEMRKHFCDFTRKGLSNIREPGLSEGDTQATIEMMEGAYQEAFGEEVKPILDKIMAAMKAVNEGKRTEEQAIEFISRELGCSYQDLKGIRQ